MICNSCEKRFDVPKEVNVHILHDEVDTRQVESITEQHCPYCFSQDIEETGHCLVCGAETKDYFCEECVRTAERQVEEMAEYFNADVETMRDLLAEIL